MILNGFKLYAEPYITDAFCECGTQLAQVNNGIFSVALFCHKCENVYALKKVKIPKAKVDEEMLNGFRKEVLQRELGKIDPETLGFMPKKKTKKKTKKKS